MKRVLVIGPGPAQIGEGGELDASAAEGLRWLRACGHEVVFVTSNPSTVASDPSLADRTYLEPLDFGALRAIVREEAPLAVFPAFGGVKAAQIAASLDDEGVLSETGSKLFGAPASVLRAALVGASSAPGRRRELSGDKSWTSFEVVFAVDGTGDFLPICTIESFDAADIHPGDAVAVTPVRSRPATHTSELHEAARAAFASLGTSSGIATCELAQRSADGAVRVLAITPGYTRSSAMAERTTGFPVARVAVDLARGLLLSALSLPNPSTEKIVVRWPRFIFETFPEADQSLGVHRKSLGESLGVGATLAEALRNAARGADAGFSRTRVRPHATSYPSSRRVLVLGAGPSQIGQGPELAACAGEVLAAAREQGFAAVFVDSSAESLSVAALFADHVHVEPVTLERVLSLYHRERAAGVILQVGGELAHRLGVELESAGVRVFGTSPTSAARVVAAVDRVDEAILRDAIAVDVDAVSDGVRVVIAGVTECLEPASVHGGDAAALLPAYSLHPDIVVQLEERVRSIALEFGVVGFLGVRLAVLGKKIFVLEIEPRAGRTTAFVSRATGFALGRVATKVMLGKTLDELGVTEPPLPRHVSARERVFPFERLGVDPALGREMHSTGEVIGLDDSPARAYGKALRGMGICLRAPSSETVSSARTVLLCVSAADKTAAVDLARRFRAIGYDVSALGEVRAALAGARVPFRDAGSVDGAASEIRDGAIAFAVVTAREETEVDWTRTLRAATFSARIPCFTTLRLALLGCSALEEDPTPRVLPLQEWYAADA